MGMPYIGINVSDVEASYPSIDASVMKACDGLMNKP